MKKIVLLAIFNIYVIGQMSAHPGHGIGEFGPLHHWTSVSHFGLIWISLVIVIIAAYLKKWDKKPIQ